MGRRADLPPRGRAAGLAAGWHAAYCLTGAILTGIISTGAALAGTHLVLHGTDLDISAPCAQVALTIDPSLKDGLALEEGSKNTARPQSRNDGAEEHLSLVLPSCARSNRVNLHLSPSTTLTLHDSPQATITINGTLAALESSLEDSTLTLDHVQSLDLALQGNSIAHIRQLDRAAQIAASGNSTLTIDKADLSVLSGKFSENSQLSLSKGQIETLNLTATDNAHITLTATSKIANIVSNGQSHVILGPVADTLNHAGTTPIHQESSLDVSGSAPSPAVPSTINAVNRASIQSGQTEQPAARPHISSSDVKPPSSSQLSPASPVGAAPAASAPMMVEKPRPDSALLSSSPVADHAQNDASRHDISEAAPAPADNSTTQASTTQTHAPSPHSTQNISPASSAPANMPPSSAAQAGTAQNNVTQEDAPQSATPEPARQQDRPPTTDTTRQTQSPPNPSRQEAPVKEPLQEHQTGQTSADNMPQIKNMPVQTDGAAQGLLGTQPPATKTGKADTDHIPADHKPIDKTP